MSVNNSELDSSSHKGPSGKEIESARISILELISIMDKIELS